MNSIVASYRNSKFVEEKHLVFLIDGDPLDLVIDRMLPGENSVEGLVPTLLGWLSDTEEDVLVWNRSLPNIGERVSFPVLVCPDDLDLWCTVVIAEVEASSSSITWRRLGLDSTDPEGYTSAQCGEKVTWISGLGPFVFDRVEYEACLRKFRSNSGGKTA